MMVSPKSKLSIRRQCSLLAISRASFYYSPMQKGFMYLTAIIDVYSRYIVGWGLSNTLDAAVSLQVLRQAVANHGKPEIVNSDQGSQFTCKDYVQYLKDESISISMDGKGRALAA